MKAKNRRRTETLGPARVSPARGKEIRAELERQGWTLSRAMRALDALVRVTQKAATGDADGARLLAQQVLGARDLS